MSDIPKFFENDEFLIDEKVAVFKFENEYKIFDPKGNQIGAVKQKLSTGAKIARLFLNKAMMPFELIIEDENAKPLISVKRGWTLWMSKIELVDGMGVVQGSIKQKFQLLKPRFQIFDASGALIGNIQGDWKAWNFVITDENDKEIGKINKKWAGAAREIFTTADKYYVSIDPNYSEDSTKVNILAAAITIDMVLKETS